MVPIDYGIIILYLAVVLSLGFWYHKRASKNLESYFLGGKKIHWLALAMSGSVSNFDITGTMWIVSMLFLFGMKSMWIHWMWGWMMGAFFLAYMGKWVRRSNVMTGAEWMVTRFGRGQGGSMARTAYAFMAVITQASFIGYAFQGIGKFASVYLDLSPTLCGILIIGVTTFYVVLGGLYSVVITDVVQTIILTVAGILIAGIAYTHLTPETLGRILPDNWHSLIPVWRIPEFAGTTNAGYEFFGALVMVWVLKGFLLNAGGPAQMYDFQRFLAARDSRDAAKVGAAWSGFLVVRWGMAMGIVLLALTGLGQVNDPERVMPHVLQQYLPAGVRGVVVAGLLAAFMSTFSSTVNSGASYIVRDIWQPTFRPQADEKSLVRCGYAATIGIVLCGILIGFQADSITQIWSWMMMALGAGVVVPNVLRWYWWRLNGWGYAAGTIAGILFFLIALFMPQLPMFVVFPSVLLNSTLISVIVSLKTTPVDNPVLISFYTTVHPFGWWQPVRRQIQNSMDRSRILSEKAPWAVFNTCLGIVAISGSYFAPMYLVGHWHTRALAWLMVALVSMIILYFTWFRRLPSGSDL